MQWTLEAPLWDGRLELRWASGFVRWDQTPYGNLNTQTWAKEWSGERGNENTPWMNKIFMVINNMRRFKEMFNKQLPDGGEIGLLQTSNNSTTSSVPMRLLQRGGNILVKLDLLDHMSFSLNLGLQASLEWG